MKYGIDKRLLSKARARDASAYALLLDAYQATTSHAALSKLCHAVDLLLDRVGACEIELSRTE